MSANGQVWKIMPNVFSEVTMNDGVRERFMIVGSGGRECAFAVRLAEDASVYAMMGHENPMIMSCVEHSGGKWEVGDPSDPGTVLDFAKRHGINYAFVSSDEPLANGVVDVLLEHGFKCVGATKAAARIEWDKAYSMGLTRGACGNDFTPVYSIISSMDEIDGALSIFKKRNLQVVVKPQGLTGGKGVKVMPEHLKTYDDCAAYASELLRSRSGEKVLFVERLHGIEFTIMGITDGRTLVMSPASYDYPYRHVGDTGAGTGGMGCFTNSEHRLPFMTQKDLDDCRTMMERVIDAMRKKGTPFTGVLNGGFFKTKSGIKFMEWNGRFGDPESLNILSLLEGSFSKLLKDIWNKTLSNDTIKFAGKASVIKYMVVKEYPEPSPAPIQFVIDEESVNALGVNLFFASCVQTGKHTYQTLKTSRVVAFGALADTIGDASELVDIAIKDYFRGNLDYRHDIGTTEYVSKLKEEAAGASKPTPTAKLLKK